jgi:nicotinate-nucleotide pyrophosphorylase (carboxylating)
MLKDNHLVAIRGVESLAKKIVQLKEKYPGIPVIVEADLFSQVESFLQVPGIDRILLDNMNRRNLKHAVQLRDQINPKVQLEASGGVNLKTVKSIAETGVDSISVGALTHSIRAIDFGLDLIDL